jgi:hypothetical protein
VAFKAIVWGSFHPATNLIATGVGTERADKIAAGNGFDIKDPDNSAVEVVLDETLQNMQDAKMLMTVLTQRDAAIKGWLIFEE